jgi:hypothetical protein
MSADECLERAEQCERMAARATLADHRATLTYMAARWRALAGDGQEAEKPSRLPAPSTRPSEQE